MHEGYDYEAEDREIELEEERKELARDVAIYRGLIHEAGTERIERARGTGIDRPADDYSAELRAAEEALAKFDADHPEVKAEMARERADRTARHMWD